MQKALLFLLLACVLPYVLSVCPVNITCSTTAATSCSTYCTANTSTTCTLCNWSPDAGSFFTCASGKCLNLLCTADTQCSYLSKSNQSVGYCDTEAGFCRARPFYASTNDKCANDTDCLSNNCTNSVCAGIPLGRSCIVSTTANPCFYGGFCDPDYDNNCNDLRTAGQQCNGPYMCDTYLCGAQTIISPSTYCLQRYGKTAQLYCGSGVECQSTYCNQTNACADPSVSYNLTANSEISCTNATTCLSVDATCDPVKCQCENPNATIALSCTQLEMDQHNCLVAAECPYESDPTYNNSCAYINCGSQIACYQACLHGSSSPATNLLLSTCGWQSQLLESNSIGTCPVPPPSSTSDAARTFRYIPLLASILLFLYMLC